jgi:uncharacterized protein (TIGR02722 family)
MKTRSLFGLFCIVAALGMAACASNPKVTRVDPAARTDLSGYWNDTDVRIVCESLINACLNSARVNQEIGRMGRTPVFLVGRFRNESDEHIDTAIISSAMEVAIFNSGRADFAAAGSTREEIREERQDQQGNASESTAKALGNETGADFLLTGDVRTIVDRAGGTSTRTYYITAELTNIETNTRLWMDRNTDIKKVIVQPGVKF